MRTCRELAEKAREAMAHEIDNKVYKYEYLVTHLGDGSFNQAHDKKLREWLDSGWKALRELAVGDGYVLFVLSKAVEE